MATYAIGDVQGCFEQLIALLEKINYHPGVDQLIFAGDLVNRGRSSLETLRFISKLPENNVAVLGNHDLYLLCVAAGKAELTKTDTVTDILTAPDREELLTWLRHRPLLYHEKITDFVIVHAGLYPHWSLELAKTYAHEVEAALQGENYQKYFAHMEGDKPKRWQTSLTGWKRLRFITNCFTRMRFCDLDGRLDLESKGEIGSQRKDFLPWFEVPNRATAHHKIAFGHWAALGTRATGPNVFAIDSGCVWGGCLTALRLEDHERFTVPCKDLK